jgi:PAS domain S-box-containing protein
MGIMRADGVNVVAIHSGAVKKQDYAFVVKDLVQRGGRHELSLVSMPDGRKLIGSVFKLEGGLLGGDHAFYVYFLKEYVEAMGPLRGIMGSLVLLWLGMMILFSFVSVVLVNKFLAPIGELRKGFSFLKRGLLDQRISIKSGDEFEVLARDFNAMMEELRGNMVSKDHFNQIIQNMSDILFVVDGHGAIDLINRRACEMLEYGENELKGVPAIQILAKKDRYIISWGLKGLIDEGALRDKKISLLSKSGREIEVYLGTRSLRDMANSLVGLVCLAKDLTEINKLMEALRRSNEEILKNKKELEDSLKELMSSRDIMLSVLEDTNESKLALEATLKRLRETQDQLLQAEKMVSLGQIAAGVAHEINNPLFVISGESEMMGFEENIPQSMKDSIKTIREQVHRISDIIKRMLEFSRKKEAKFVAVEIDPLLQKSIDLLQYQVKVMGNIEIAKEFAAGTAKVNGDINQLTEVFINLMINAAQSMEVKGGTLTVRSFSEIIKPSQLKIGSPLKIDDHVVCIQVSDTGTGISEETMRKIFDPFFTTKKTGTGLGLSVCFGIIETHGGTIEVASAPDQGTTFTVYIPVLETN